MSSGDLAVFPSRVRFDPVTGKIDASQLPDAAPGGPTSGIYTGLNIVDYGGVGNGVFDNTAAFAAAFAAAGPISTIYGATMSVYVPDGVWITSTIHGKHRTALVGAGWSTRIKLKNGAGARVNLVMNEQNYAGVDDAQGFQIRDLRLDGNRPNNAGTWNSGIVLRNDTPATNFQYNDGRHQVSNVMIENFSGNGFVQSGRGTVQATNVQVWDVDGFGFNVDMDSEYSNCDAGGTGLCAWLVQGNNLFANCKGWFAGSKLTSNRFNAGTATATTVTPPANAWDGGNVPGLVFSLANGWGNGWTFRKISENTVGPTSQGGTLTGCCAQDNARAGFFLDCSRYTLVGCESDSNSNAGTVSGGAQLGSYSGFELTANAFRNTIIGMSWERGGNLAHQAAALAIANGAGDNRIQLTCTGTTAGGATMPPLAAGSVVGPNLVEFQSMGGGYVTPAYAAAYTPDPFKSEVHAMTLTGNVTVGAPAWGGPAGAVSNTAAGIYLIPGMRLRLQFTQDATGGRTVTLNGVFKTNGYAFSTVANVVSSVTFVWDGTNWQGIGGSSNTAGLDAASRAFFSQTPPARPAAGEYHIALNSGTGTASGWTLGEVRFQKIALAVATPISHLAVSTSVVAAGGTTPRWVMGVYNDDGTGLKPAGAPIAGTECSTAADAGTGARDTALPSGNVTLPPGEYHLACMLTSVGGTALTTVPTMTTLNTVMNLGVSNLTNVSHRCWAQGAGSSAAALPTVSGLYRVGAPPIIGAKVAA